MNMATNPASLKATPIVDASVAPTPSVLPDAPSSHGGLKRGLGVAGVLLLVGALAYAGTEYWTQWRFETSTDDAYVQADIVTIAPQVAGYLVTVNVTDNQPVKQGEVLAIIDPRPYQAAVDQAVADVDAARASIDDHAAQLNEQQALIEEAKAQIAADAAAETFAEQNNRRFTKLAQDGFGPVETAEQTTSQIGQTQAQVTRDRAALDAAQKQVATLTAQLAEARANLAHNQAALDTATLNLGYTRLVAPVDGVVGARTLRVGQYVEPGTALLAVVPLQATYVVANYKETQLTDVKPDQKVTISVDTYPDLHVRGFVSSLAPASGQEFALLPPDNATGNFTKIVQRIPVRIDIDRTDPLARQLRPGMSVETTIRTDATIPADVRRNAYIPPSE
ncbi:membrane fusion protein (multidrug efflux system) [Angulomicrobium tetraedrale]|uniref:Membrane fusion protein (Multidrug efflux system) n=1 Tax=Ancylobacter tetraedralis TaxID=217068 RepID=A0A839Z7B4_9HYPH|nr:HlyD family secretion protein [Ancylobacter tetraedralis]MBB3770550.1 membrane fusion protein (multidrug efflux system) [Ancylobacter tetraedralis]